MRFTQRSFALVALQLFVGVVATPGLAATLNIDIEADLGVDVTHVGTDAVLSASGTYWNGVEAGLDAISVLDEKGSTTAIDVVWPIGGTGGTDPTATNDLQDSGTFSTVEINGLTATGTYDIAIYSGPGAIFEFVDSAGASFVFCTNSAPITYALPGTEGGDYCLLTGRIPADFGGGVSGFRVTPVDGLVTAIQIPLPDDGDPPVTVPLASAAGLVGMMMGLGVLGVARLKRVEFRRWPAGWADIGTR